MRQSIGTRLVRPYPQAAIAPACRFAPHCVRRGLVVKHRGCQFGREKTRPDGIGCDPVGDHASAMARVSWRYRLSLPRRRCRPERRASSGGTQNSRSAPSPLSFIAGTKAWDRKERRDRFSASVWSHPPGHVIRRLAGVDASRMDQNVGRAKWGANVAHSSSRPRGRPHPPTTPQRQADFSAQYPVHRPTCNAYNLRPAAAKRIARTRPSPELAPVMHATLPLRSKMAAEDQPSASGQSFHLGSISQAAHQLRARALPCLPAVKSAPWQSRHP